MSSPQPPSAGPEGGRGESAGAGALPFVLVQLTGPAKGIRYSPSATPVTIGRDTACTIHLDDNAASKCHTEIVVRQNQIVIRDLDSKNGTSVNGQSIAESDLVAGDLIRIGNACFLAVADEATEDFDGSTAGASAFSFDAHCALIGLSGQVDGCVFPLGREPITIGRAAGNVVRLDDDAVSDFHAQVANTSRGPRIVDLASKAGIRVNGEPVKVRALADGDVVQVGAARFRFEIVTSSLTPQATPEPATLDIPDARREQPAAKARAQQQTILVSDTATSGPPPLVLVCIEGKDKGRSWCVGAAKATIGRGSACDIALADPGVSRTHAEIVPGPHGPTIADADSRNGLLVNDEKVKSAVLKVGDTVLIGETLLTVQGAAE